jgi:hypothetical protein
MFLFKVTSCLGDRINMYRKLEIRTLFLIILLTLSITFLGALTPTKAETTTVVYVDPSEVKDVFSPSTFTINVKVANVTNLYGIDVQFAWDPSVIKYVSHVKMIPVETYPAGVLHKTTLSVMDQVDENASMPGSEPGTMYWLSEASLAPAKVFNGSGTIFTMTFQVVGLGTSPLKIVACTLADKSGNPIDYTAKNGEFVNYVPPPPPPGDIFVNPSSIVNSTLTPSSNFSISVDVKKIQSLYSYDFALAYNGTLIEVAKVTGNIAFPAPTVTQGAGNVRISSSLVSPSSPISGNFSLATITFHVLAVGETDLDLHDVILKDNTGENITFNTPGDGFFANSAVFKIAATVDVKPDALNLKSIGRWLTVYVELPEGYDVNDIDVSTVKLNGTISANALASNQVGDYDGDGIDDILVKFNRTQVITFISAAHTGVFNLTAGFVVTGKLVTGVSFEGSDVVKVSNLLGDANGDGKVDILDLVLGAISYNSTDDGLNWNPNVNFVNFAVSYNRIDILDLVTIVSQYGKKVS